MDIFHVGLQVLAHPLMMLIYGLLVHFARKRLASMTHETSKTICFADYWRLHPVQSVISVVSAFVGFIIFVGIDLPDKEGQMMDLARMSAFGIGYMADNIADAIGERTMRSLGTGNGGQKPP